ncbi:MAG: hypothetical protein GY842_18015 [bacterium]|nr:hypothetical protein [bacterium]
MHMRRWGFYVCFLVSGLSALVYEVVWQRMLTLVLGVSTWSIAAVLTAYMAGLALGAWAFGRVADRSSNAARLYGGIELAIAAAGLLVTYSINPLLSAYVRVAHSLDPSLHLSSLIRFALALAVLLVPCMLIGATVPVMGRLMTRSLGSVGVGFGRFYAINTLGAVLGAGLAGFFLIRLVGMGAAVYVAVAGNLFVAVLAMVLSLTTDPPAVSRPDPEVSPADPPPNGAGQSRAVMVLAGITGLTALGYEVAWARLLAIFTLNSVYVFSMILTVYLAGLAAGSAIAARVIRRGKISLWLVVAVVQMLLAMTTPVMLSLRGIAAELGHTYVYHDPAYLWLTEYAMVAAVVLVPTLLLGATLPLLVALVPGGTQAPGRTVGRVYALNSVGTIFGAAVTGLVLIPCCGLRTTLMLFAVANFCVGCYAAHVAAPTNSRWRILTPVGSICLVLLSLLAPFGARFIRPAGVDDEAAILYYREGETSVVHIAQTRARGRDFRVLYVDSQSVAGTSDEIVTDQKMLAHLPLLLHPDPQRALTVGFGTGGTSYSMLLHRVETHCVEIERAVPAGARYFVKQNGGVVSLAAGLDVGRKDFRLILDDARSWLHRATEPYDVIVDDLTSIQYRGNGNLFTVECFELIKRNLTPNGIGCAWVPLTGVDPEPLRVVVRSFREAFPHTSIWYMSNLVNDFIILVGTPGPLELDLEDWSRRMAEPAVADDLQLVELQNPYKLAGGLLLTEAEVDCFVGPGPLHTDDQPILDYLTHAGAYHDTLVENLRALIACRTDSRDRVSSAPEGVSYDAFTEEWERWHQAVGHLLSGHAFQRAGDSGAARESYRRAGELVPEDPGIARLAGL